MLILQDFSKQDNRSRVADILYTPVYFRVALYIQTVKIAIYCRHKQTIESYITDPKLLYDIITTQTNLTKAEQSLRLI